ncbi:hypothetical protein ACFOSV_13375 [Algoriphagus namhaensis]|uniref:Uncharacterized protein n=1 Tax=Algoriphagus namhaensis TaxID=915353 RepID=A0ABV8ATA1_9BACT
MVKLKPFSRIIVSNTIFLSIAILVSISGFWNIYFGPNSAPTFYQNIHVLTTFAWLFLLMTQLIFIAKANFLMHIKLGASILILGPSLIATLVLLSVHSAARAAGQGEADMLVIQNIFPALEVGLLLILGFIFRRNRILHGQLLVSTTLFFFGIALFFTLISFVPQYQITGPETLYRFEDAGITATYISAFFGMILFFVQRRSGWPWLLVTALFFINGYINYLITEANQAKALTALIGSVNEYLAFFGTFLIALSSLIFSLSEYMTKRLGQVKR